MPPRASIRSCDLQTKRAAPMGQPFDISKNGRKRLYHAVWHLVPGTPLCSAQEDFAAAAAYDLALPTPGRNALQTAAGRTAHEASAFPAMQPTVDPQTAFIQKRQHSLLHCCSCASRRILPKYSAYLMNDSSTSRQITIASTVTKSCGTSRHRIRTNIDR